VKVAASDRWRGSSGNSPVQRPKVAITKAAKTDLVMNSLATRWTFPMMRRPSATASGMAPNRSETSTESATLFASCVPLPSATASLALFIAGTSLTPSPIMATYEPFCRSASIRRRLSSGVSRANTVVAEARTASCSASSGRSDPCTAPLPARMPTRSATAVTVVGESPDITFTSTPCS